MDRVGGKRRYAEIAPGQRKRQQTRPGATWMIVSEDGIARGYFRVGDRSSQAVIPR